MKKEYRTAVIAESGLMNIIFGESKLPVEKMQALMNHYGSHGWRLAFQLVEERRYLVLFKKEVVVLTFERDIDSSAENNPSL